MHFTRCDLRRPGRKPATVRRFPELWLVSKFAGLAVVDAVAGAQTHRLFPVALALEELFGLAPLPPSMSVHESLGSGTSFRCRGLSDPPSRHQLAQGVVPIFSTLSGTLHSNAATNLQVWLASSISNEWHCKAISKSPTVSPQPLHIAGQSYAVDEWTNVPPHIISRLPRRLHLQPAHPIALTRKLIETHFPSPTYAHYNDFSPFVSTAQNFDSLGFPPDHPGRSRTDTYYLNAHTCLRTHTSAHEAETFRADASPGYTISADVYRRDAIDSSHYPIFHQMEGARMWDRRSVASGNVAEVVQRDLATLPARRPEVEDPHPAVHPERNPLQPGHTLEEIEAISAHLKRSLEAVVLDIFSQARQATDAADEPLRVRWVETYFPNTSPSWELEVYWRGAWLELLGCGIVQQRILEAAGVPQKLGWAFGVGLERVAMLLYAIPDIRLFWSEDSRFLDQFAEGRPPRRFVPFSKYPASPRDVAFWVGGSRSAAGGRGPVFHENDVMQIVRDIGADLVEDVRLVDEFEHPQTGRKSLCYRIVYRSLERVLSRDESNDMHAKITTALREDLGVEIR